MTSTRFATNTTFITTLQSQYAMSAIVKIIVPMPFLIPITLKILYSIIQIKQPIKSIPTFIITRKQKQQQQIFQIS